MRDADAADRPDGAVRDDDAPLDPAASLALIRAQEQRVRDRATPDSRLLLAVWGVAWLVGYLTIFFDARSQEGNDASGRAFAVFAVCIASGVVATIVHISRRTAGVHGVSARAGAMYGWSWQVGFIGIVLITSGLERAGASPEVLSLAWNALPCLLVGLLYLVGGALWDDRTMFALGGWIVLVGGSATLVGLPTSYLIMALAGGGGFLVGALVMHLLRRRAL